MRAGAARSPFCRCSERRPFVAMNYRHAFHAGNFADVFKHVLLSRALVALRRKSTPWRYLDTHAGIGWYDLASEEARRGAEWQGGIGRLDMSRATPDVQMLLAPYLDAVGPRDAGGRPSLYPGSPGIAQQLCRADDRLILCELHPLDGPILRQGFKGDRRAKMVAIDGYLALRAYLPPPERRGLVLVDPPFEDKNEFTAMTENLLAAHRRWPTGIYMLWYPVKDREALIRFAAALVSSGLQRMAQAELLVQPDALSRGALAGCGMIVVNPPFGFAAEMGQLLPFLAQVLGREEPGSWRWRFLTAE